MGSGPLFVPGDRPIPSLIGSVRISGRVYLRRDDVVHFLRRKIDGLDAAEAREVLNELIGKLERAQ